MELPGRQWAITGGTLGWLPPGCAHQAGLRRRGGLESVSAGGKRAGDAAAAAAVHGLCAVAGLVERIAQFPPAR
ncbi:hypothetical protein M8494_21465 [Serratia ureilytica]